MKKKTLVFGASKNLHRYSNMAVQKLMRSNFEVATFSSNQGEISGLHIDTELKNYKNIDTVTLYLNPSKQKDYFEYIVSLNPKRVIFNPGTENPEFYEILKVNKIEFEEACTLTLLVTNQY